MRELVPTAAVWRGNGMASDIGVASRGIEAAIDALTFEDLQGRVARGQIRSRRPARGWHHRVASR